VQEPQTFGTTVRIAVIGRFEAAVKFINQLEELNLTNSRIAALKSTVGL
jgi:hypothetical protein